MGNPFKQILENRELPDAIKSKVMKDVDLIKLSLDLADLFVVKCPASLEDVLRVRQNGKDKQS